MGKTAKACLPVWGSSRPFPMGKEPPYGFGLGRGKRGRGEGPGGPPHEMGQSLANPGYLENPCPLTRFPFVVDAPVGERTDCRL